MHSMFKIVILRWIFLYFFIRNNITKYECDVKNIFMMGELQIQKVIKLRKC